MTENGKHMIQYVMYRFGVLCKCTEYDTYDVIWTVHRPSGSVAIANAGGPGRQKEKCQRIECSL